MVQKEVGERFFAVPGSKAYGAVSVLVQLSARRTGSHAVSRTVFRPRPRVDSMLVAFVRLPQPPRRIGTSCTARSPTVGRRFPTHWSSQVSPPASPLPRARRSSDTSATRAEELAPEEFVRLAELIP
jgi:16S rRNA A1518/A1519 N6-dimethyltransferase RsmA/KsgA/DIM1 with predicted DNA glycosylase/AP lyase activity